jgi:hypothetical protein
VGWVQMRLLQHEKDEARSQYNCSPHCSRATSHEVALLFLARLPDPHASMQRLPAAIYNPVPHPNAARSFSRPHNPADAPAVHQDPSRGPDSRPKREPFSVPATSVSSLTEFA